MSAAEWRRAQGLPPPGADRVALARLAEHVPAHLAHRPGRMNKTEEAYANYLEVLKRAGEIRDWRFEELKLRLADNTFYSPDFLIWPIDSLLELHEVKGFWRDDARVKFKVARDRFPMFRFRAVRRVGAGWEIT